jgi:hypothetical protein
MGEAAVVLMEAMFPRQNNPQKPRIRAQISNSRSNPSPGRPKAEEIMVREIF